MSLPPNLFDVVGDVADQLEDRHLSNVLIFDLYIQGRMEPHVVRVADHGEESRTLGQGLIASHPLVRCFAVDSSLQMDR